MIKAKILTKVYKVTSLDSRSNSPNIYMLQYSLYETSYPIIGKIFAYKTFADAERFAISHMQKRLIWEAEADIFKEENIRMTWSGLRDFWEGKNCLSNDAPRGTVLCNNLRLKNLIGIYGSNVYNDENGFYTKSFNEDKQRT